MGAVNKRLPGRKIEMEDGGVKYTREVELPNGHKWRQRADGGWCRFSKKTCYPSSSSLNGNQSRINVANGPTRFTPLRPTTGQPVSAGWTHVVDGHFNRPLGQNRSVFTISESDLKSILQSPSVVSSPIQRIPGGQFVRIVDTGVTVGNASLKQGGNPTTWIKVFTDHKGNLITTYPVNP